MRPRKLRMENVGPFVGTAEVDFDALGDIFLISGRTGSGKTTIFDAICYALYGALPGSRRDHVRRLRSDFADEGADCSVSLVFSVGEETYRIDRSPPRSRRKARGEGYVEDPETAALYRLDGSGGATAQGGKKSEADERIVELIGLSLDEFSKIVLLPQGEFAEFLRQKTADRREVLGKLFPVDLAVRARELAAARRREADARLAEAERRVVELQARFSVDSYGDARSGAEEALRERDRAIARLDGERAALETAARAVAEEEETQARLAAAVEAEREIEGEAPAAAAAEAELASARKARPLLPLLRRRDETAAEAQRSAAAARDAVRAEAELEAAAAAIEADAPRVAALERELSALREKRGPLALAAEEESVLGAEREKLARLGSELEETERRVRTADAEAAAREAELAALGPAAESSDAADEAWERERAAMERARALKAAADRHEKLAQEREAARSAERGLGSEIERRGRELETLRAELAELEGRIADSELAGRAAALAAELSPGAPCPVCGSRDHPAPAAARPPAFGLADRRAARARAVEDAAQLLSARSAQREAAAREASRLEAEAEEARRQCAAAAEADPASYLPPSGAEAAVELAARVAETNAAQAGRVEARRARDRLAALRRDAEPAKKAAEELLVRRARLEAERSAAEAAIAERSRRVGQAVAAAGGAGGAAAGLRALDGRIAALEAETRGCRERREETAAARAAARARSEAAAAAAADAELGAARAREEFAEALARSAFSDEAELRAALRDEARERELEATVARWNERRNEERTLREALAEEAVRRREARERAIAGLGVEAAGEASVGGLLERNRAARERAAAERDEAAAALAALDGEKAAYEEAEKRRAEVAREAAAIRALSDDLSGNNPKKRAFDAWLLALYLEEVAAYASKRLERMSEGRYRLVMDADREGGRGRTGLDLAVFDAHTGRSRPCGTLSGGESFMASISLALGLADSIQARSGGVRLDAVFIDEGFGSLDEASLDKALGILDEIRDHRMVGLISHVAELRSRIPGRVEIVKTSVGSRIATEERA